MRDGPRLRLREVTLADAPALDRRDADPTVSGEFNDFGPRARRPVAEQLAQAQRLVSIERGRLIVERRGDGTVIGDVSWHATRYGPGDTSRALNMGIALYPEARGQGFGSEAQRLLAELLLDRFEVERIEASTDVDNIAEQRALDKAGFTREGVIRRAQFRGGRYHDLVGYSFVRGDLATTR
ncbi:MAG: GNAT family N-acetyltransferase [Candidatus Limnocylindrales bacterium]